MPSRAQPEPQLPSLPSSEFLRLLSTDALAPPIRAFAARLCASLPPAVVVSLLPSALAPLSVHALPRPLVLSASSARLLLLVVAIALLPPPSLYACAPSPPGLERMVRRL